ncbi:NADH:flavin oxidoreductase / NADH oxidase family protein [Pseudomonas sp. NFIX28]|nr:NADH:flavin oxidoreductase / NADH oxidase family protein [Pseudomonas sp. NFIX28]
MAPSVVALKLGALSRMFQVPREMIEADIAEVVRRFTHTAVLAEQAGFTGVQIHAAHGYLLSQFLSPLSNRRTDRWGGSVQNRARLLLEIIRAVRAGGADLLRGGQAQLCGFPARRLRCPRRATNVGDAQ